MNLALFFTGFPLGITFAFSFSRYQTLQAIGQLGPTISSLMERDNSNRSPRPPYNIVCALNETLNRPFQPRWSTPRQANHNFGAMPTPFVSSYPNNSYFHPYLWPNQEAAYRHPSLHHLRGLPNHPIVAEHDAATFLYGVSRIINYQNMDSTRRYNANLHPRSFVAMESSETGNGYSIFKNERDEALRSTTSGSMGFLDEGHGINKDSSTSEKHQSNMMLGIGETAQKMDSSQNCNLVPEHRNSVLMDLREDATELNLNLGISLNEFGAKTQQAKLEHDERRNQRKRKSKGKSARRSKIQKELDDEELKRTVDTLTMENSSLTAKLVDLSEECLVLNEENKSIEDELVKAHGEEAIADLLAMRPGVPR